MQAATFDVRQLSSLDRWNAASFIGGSSSQIKTKQKLMRLSNIATERCEFLEPQNFKDHIFNYIGLENIEGATGDLVNFAPKTGSEIKSRSKVFRCGDVLYGRLRPTLNKCLLVETNLSEGISTTEVIVLIPDQRVIRPLFLKYLLLSNYVVEQVGALISGAALPRVGAADFFGLELPVPSLALQDEYERQIQQLEIKRREARAAADNISRNLAAAVWAAALRKTPLDIAVPNAPDVPRWHNPLPATFPAASQRGRPSRQGSLQLSKLEIS